MVGAPLVLDTNIVLDLLVFEDAAAQPLQDALRNSTVAWLATDAMRTELTRVLTYPQVAARLRARGRTADEVLVQFDRLSRTAPPAAAAPVRCSDRDDQIFVDLAVAHQALLISKDRQVVRLHKRLALLGVRVQASAAQAFGPGDQGQCAPTFKRASSHSEDPR